MIPPPSLYAECRPTLRLEATVGTPIVAPGDPLEVTVTLRNPADRGPHPSMCAMVQAFLAEREPNTEGYLVVQFEIVGPDGVLLKRTKPTFAIPVRPSLEEFSYLPPGGFFGRTFSLRDAPLGYETPSAGTYKITATLTTAGRDYFEAQRKRLKGKQWLSVDPKDVLQGELRSGTVEVQVK